MFDGQSLDLADPKILAAQCVELAAGMDQQATASRGGTALGGAPYPEQFYLRCARIFRACEALAMKVASAKKPGPKPATEDPAIDVPVEGKKK